MKPPTYGGYSAKGDTEGHIPTAIELAFHPLFKYMGEQIMIAKQADSKANFERMNMTASYRCVWSCLNAV